MADIILKNAKGTPQLYSGVTKINVPTSDGGVATYSEGGGSSVIEVTEFPTENVQEDVIYKKKVEKIKVISFIDGVMEVIDTDTFTSIQVVEELPSDMKLSDFITEIHLYVCNSIGYLNAGEIIITLGQFISEMSGVILEDKRANSVDEITENGVYVIFEVQKINGVKGATISYVEEDWIDYESIFYKKIKVFTHKGIRDIPSYAFELCNGLTSVDIPQATYIGKEAFQDCISLVSVNAPQVTDVGMSVFDSCYSLVSVNIPLIEKLGFSTFRKCYSLIALIIGSSQVCDLGETGVFESCYHILGTVDEEYNPNGLKDGFIYVNDTLLDSYKSATNWAKYADQIKPISELPQEFKDLYNIA